MTKKRSNQLKLIREFVTAMMNRKSRSDDICRDVCWDEKERKKIIKEIAELDKEIEANMAKWKDFFPALSTFEDCEIAVLMFCFASIYSNDIPSIDSRDLFSTILRDSESALDTVMTSLSSGGRLHEWIEKKESRSSRNAYGLMVRSLEMFEKSIFGE